MLHPSRVAKNFYPLKLYFIWRWIDGKNDTWNVEYENFKKLECKDFIKAFLERFYWKIWLNENKNWLKKAALTNQVISQVFCLLWIIDVALQG